MLLPSQLALRNRISHLVTILILLTVFQAWWSSSTQAQLLNDQAIRITSISDAQQRRQQLISYIWGTGGFPSTTRLPRRTTLSGPPTDLTPTGVPLKNLARVDKLTVTMDGPVNEPPLESIAYHLIPQRKNHRLVIMNPGHACSYTEQVGSPDSDFGYGDLRTLNALLHEGYSVQATYMPNFQPGACEIDGTAINHNDLMIKTVRGTGSPLKWFFEPIAVSLNYLRSQYSVDQFPQYEEYDFVGLSGGGWTAVVYAAIDPTIQVTISISGSIPLYLRSGGSTGDSEQTIQSFYSIAGYPELYVLGSLGPNRRQIQVLNRRDNCCFSEWQHPGLNWQEAMRNTERDVRTTLFNLGSTTGAGFFSSGDR